MPNAFENFILTRLRDSSKPIELTNGFPVAACFKNLNLVDIPRVMREKKLTKGAELMEHWFLGKSFVMPKEWKAAPPKAIDPRTIKNEHINETIITMKWAFGFARTLTAYKELKQAVTGTLTQESLELSKGELFGSMTYSGTHKQGQGRYGSQYRWHQPCEWQIPRRIPKTDPGTVGVI